MSLNNLSLVAIADQIQSDSAGNLVIDKEKIETKSIGGRLAWIFHATYGIYPVDFYIYPGLKGFTYQIVGRDPNNVTDCCTNETLYDDKIVFALKKVFGNPPTLSETKFATENNIFRKVVHYRNPKDIEEAKEILKVALEKDMGQGPSIIDSWLMDAPKDDYADFIFVVKNLRNQKQNFDVQLQLSFSPENSSCSVYSQYIRNSDDHIFVDSDDTPLTSTDPLGNIRDYLETTVEIGNKAVILYNKKLEESE